MILEPTQYVGKGRDIQLQCSTPIPDMHYIEWLRGDTSLLIGATLTITNASEADRGEYQCGVFTLGGTGIAKRSVYLHVLSKSCVCV